MRAERLLVGVFVCCFSMSGVAQQVYQDEAKILDLEKRWTDAYRLHDIKTLTSLLADDVIVTVEDGRTFGRIGYMAHTADSAVQVNVAEQSDLNVRLHGNVAVITGGYHETGSAKGKPYEYRDRFTDVWLRNNGQLIASHYSIPVQQ